MGGMSSLKDQLRADLTTAIKALDPKAEVKIDRSQNRVDVQSEQPLEALAAAIREEGYAVAA